MSVMLQLRPQQTAVALLLGSGSTQGPLVVLALATVQP